MLIEYLLHICWVFLYFVVDKSYRSWFLVKCGFNDISVGDEGLPWLSWRMLTLLRWYIFFCLITGIVDYNLKLAIAHCAYAFPSNLAYNRLQGFYFCWKNHKNRLKEQRTNKQILITNTHFTISYYKLSFRFLAILTLRDYWLKSLQKSILNSLLPSNSLQS